MIHVGTKDKRVRAGDFVEFCPVCRWTSTFSATEVREAVAISHIAVDRGAFRFVELECAACGALIARSTDHPNSSLEHIRAESERRVPIREALEDHLRAGDTTSDERAALIAEPFRELNYMWEARGNRSSMESFTAVIAFAFIVLTFGAVITFYGGHSALGWGFAGWGALALVWTVERCLTGPGKAARRFVLTPLAMSLRPLEPSMQELTETMEQLRGECRLARLLSPWRIMDAIQRVPPLPGAGRQDTSHLA